MTAGTQLFGKLIGKVYTGKIFFFSYIGLQENFDYDITIIVRQIKRLYNYKIRQYFVYIIVHVFFEYLSIKYFFYISYPPFINN